MSSSRSVEIWRERVAEWWAGAWRWALIAAGAVIAAYVILDRGVQNPSMAAVAIAVLVIGASVTASQPMAIALMALPGLFVVQRIGLGGGDLSVSDVALAAAFGTTILLGIRPFSSPMRKLLWLNLGYQFATLMTVLINPYAQNTFEWFHAWLLVSGALVVGWSLGRAGFGRLALTIMLISAGVLALATIGTAVLQYASGDFGAVYPQWPFPMHKNFAGTTLAFAALIAYVNPDWVGWSRRSARVAFWLLILAVLVTQSRQAIIGLVVAIFVVALRRGATGRSRAMVLLVVPAVWLVASMVVEQIDSQNRFNSVFQRLDWFREVYHFWRESPLFGHGLRYWYVNRDAPFQPPQAELEVLASSGLVGLVGFVVMWVGVLVVLWRVDPRFGTLALVVTLSRIVQGQFDLFWVAASVSIPFVIAGICLGAQAKDAEMTNADASSEEEVALRKRRASSGAGRTARGRKLSGGAAAPR